jgi:hypothetical protein
MDHGIAAGERRRVGFRPGKVANVRVAGDAFEVGQIAGFADKQTEFRAFIGQSAGHMMAYKSRRACEENFHSWQVSESAS